MLGELCAVGAAVCWALSVVLFKRSERVGAMGMNLFKNLLAIALLLVTLPLAGGHIPWDRSAADWLLLFVSGVLGIAVADTLVFMALERLGAGLLAVVDCAYAPCSIGLSVLLLGEHVGVELAMGAVLVVGGVLLAMAGRSDGAGGRPRGPQRRAVAVGVALGLTGIGAMAVSVVLAKPVLEHGELIEVTLVRLLSGTFAQLVWIGALPRQRQALAVLRPSGAWRTLVPASVLGCYVAMLLWLGGFKWTTVSSAAVLNQLSSVFTLVLARVMLGEELTRRRMAGCLVAVAGALVVLLR